MGLTMEILAFLSYHDTIITSRLLRSPWSTIKDSQWQTPRLKLRQWPELFWKLQPNIQDFMQ